MRFVRSITLAAFAVAPMCLGAQAAPQQPPPTWETVFVRQWKAVHDKILVMAKDAQFPDARLETRPHADSRTVLDELRHVTIGLEMSAAMAQGKQFDYAGREKADESKPRTRAVMVQEMEAAIAMNYPIVEKSPSPRLLGWLEHQAEHYGKLVSNYRLAGVVPPVSRPK